MTIYHVLKEITLLIQCLLNCLTIIKLWWCFRTETGKLRRYNEELKNRLHRTITRLKDFEDQVWTAVFLDAQN